MAENPAAHSQAVQRALAEALNSLQRQLGEVQGSFEQVKKALDEAGGEGSADRYIALLPPLVHMQAAGAALAASIESVLRFVGASGQWAGALAVGMPVAAPAPARAPLTAPVAEAPPVEEPEAAPVPVEEASAPAAPAFDVESLPEELQAMHKKAKRFAKVTVQELALYKRDEVSKGRQNKDLYRRFKEEIDKSKALYDERFQKIAGHNVDYLYDELVRTLAENDPSLLGDYPYPPSRQ